MPFDPAPYARGIRRRNSLEKERIDKRAQQARVEAGNLADQISKGDDAVQRIYLFGSLAENGPANEDFDIDLAIEGGDLYLALNITDESSFDLDIVDIDRLPEHVRKRVLSRGKVLFQRQSAGDCSAAAAALPQQ